jgi:predicted site-specific integrase-resolvase
MSDERDELVRLNVAARELGVAAKTVKKYCRCDKLRCRQLPLGHWRVYRSSLDALVRELGRETGPNRPE